MRRRRGEAKEKKNRGQRPLSDGGTEGSMEGEGLRAPRGGGRAALVVSSCAPASAAVRRSTGAGRGGGRGLVQRLAQRPPGRRALVAMYLAGHARRGGTSQQPWPAHPPRKRDTALCWPPALPSASSGGPVSGRGAQARPLQQLTLAVALALEL